MGFWTGETCEFCKGKLQEKRVTLYRKVRGGHVIVENVPAGVCSSCGNRYYSANVLKRIQETLRSRKKADRTVAVPVYSL